MGVSMRALYNAVAEGALARLQTLVLLNNRIDDECMKVLSDAMPKLRNLKELDVRVNKFGDKGFTDLCLAALQGRMRCIEVLDVRVNKIGNAGLKQLASAVKNGALGELTKLDFNTNQIG